MNRLGRIDGTLLHSWMEALLITLGIFGLLFLLAEVAGYKFRHQYDHLSIADASKRMHVPFPQSARLVRHHVRRGLDSEFWFMITMDKRDVLPFVQLVSKAYADEPCETSRTDRLNIPEDTGDYVSTPTWWKPDSPKRFIAIRPQPEYRMMLIGLDDPKTAVVYAFKWD